MLSNSKRVRVLTKLGMYAAVQTPSMGKVPDATAKSLNSPGAVKAPGVPKMKSMGLTAAANTPAAQPLKMPATQPKKPATPAAAIKSPGVAPKPASSPSVAKR